MPELGDIDRELARMQELAGMNTDGKEVVAGTESTARRKRRFPLWLGIVIGAAVIDLGARFFVPSSTLFVQKFEAFLFLATAAALAIPIVRKSPLSAFRKKAHIWLGAIFLLGAIRSGMWGFGFPVQYANLTVFVLAVVALGSLYVVRRRSARS
jgi:hypothetical protein